MEERFSLFTCCVEPIRLPVNARIAALKKDSAILDYYYLFSSLLSCLFISIFCYSLS